MHSNLLKSLLLMVALVATTAFAACGGDDNDDKTPAVSELSLSTTSIVFTKDGGTQTVNVQSAQQVTARSSADWLTVSVGTMSSALKVTPVTVVAAPNTTTAERTATVTIAAGTTTKTVAVSQAKGDEPVVEPTPEPQPTAEITATARDLARLMYPGWNLGNTMEPPVNGLNAETSWQPTKTTQQVIDYVAQQGFKSVRIPCSWNIHADADGHINAQWTARVKEVVDYCIKAGLYVVLNDHWDNGWIETNGFSDLSEANVAAKADRLKTLWTQIATAFRDYGDHLLLAGLNEPNCDSQQKTDALLRYEQAFIDAVRATGGNNAQRTLIVQGPSTDIEKTDQYYDVTRLNDTAADRLMVEVHFYTPWNLCGMEKDESWGKMFYYWGQGNHLTGSSHNATWGEESDLKKLFQRMKQKFVDRGYPVYIGEYGCQWRDVSKQSGESQAQHDQSVKLFHKTVNEQAVTMGMVPVVWDINAASQGGTRGIMTVLNRATLTVFCQPAMDGITEGVAAATWPY